MGLFNFRKFIKCVEAHYAICDVYRDGGWIENRSNCGAGGDKVSRVAFKTEFDRFGLFRFEWRNQSDVFTRSCPNRENVIWADQYGVFGRFDYEENTQQFLDLAQALGKCNNVSNGAAALVAAMLYPELRGIFSRPTSVRRPSKVALVEHNKRQALSVIWQRCEDGLVESRQVLFDVGDFTVMEICDTIREVADQSDPAREAVVDCGGVLGNYLSTAGSAGKKVGEILGSSRIVFENVQISRVNPAMQAIYAE